MVPILRHLRKSLRGDPPVGAKMGWTPTHRHRKGGFYRVLTRGTLEADRSAVVIYDDADGTVWVRSAAEFDDGRFEPVESAFDLGTKFT